MKKNLILHLRKAKLVWLPVTFFLLLASVFSVPIAIAQSAPGFIDDACEVFTVPELQETYDLVWDPECPSYDFIGASQYVKFSVSEELQYRIVTNSGGRFAPSDANLIILYSASGDIVERSSPEIDGLFTFEYSSEVITDLNPGTYYVEVATLEEELFSPVPFEFSIYSSPRVACSDINDIEFGKMVSGRWDPECVLAVTDQSLRTFTMFLSEDAIVRVQLFSSMIADAGMRLLDQNGRVVTEGDTELNTDVLPAGFYLLQATTSRGNTEEFQIHAQLLGAIPDNTFRPIQGAVGITFQDGACTLGFAATIRLAAEEIKGVVTNSHCTNIQGKQDDTHLYQGVEVITKMLTGERADPDLLNRSSPTNDFERPLDRLACSTNCQYSDAAFFELEEGFDASYSITRLKMINTNTPQWAADNDRLNRPLTQHLEVDSAMPSFEIVGIGRAEVGDTVHKIGQTTGWTTGEVTGVCELSSLGENEESVDLFCQDTFEHLEGNVVGGSGDSGSPVFKCVTASGRDAPGCRNSQRVILVGILHSVSGDDEVCYEEEGEENCYNSGASFSSVDNVLRGFNKSFESEDACWVLASAGNCYSPPTQLPQRSNNCQLDTLSMGVRVRGGFGDDCFSVLSDSGYLENARYFNLQLTGDTELQVAVRGAESATLISVDDRNYGEVVGELETSTINAQLPAADYILEVVGREGRSFSVLAADAEQGPLPHEDPILSFIHIACEVFTVPRLRATYDLVWNPECPSDRFTAVSQYIKFSVSERMEYRIATNSDSSFADSDYNFIALYDASGDIVEESSPEIDGLFTFRHSSEVISELNPGTYYVEVVTLEEELFSPVPFEFSIHLAQMPDLPPPDRPQEVTTTDNSSSSGNDTLSTIALLVLVTAVVLLVAIILRSRRGRSRRN